MRNFTNPLDNIYIASPCSANWDDMFGNDRKRFCGECKLNVYNLSDMTRRQADNLLINSEGRLCVRYFRRTDGTVLTKNCPVGWRAVKQRVSRVATAAFSMLAGLFSGIFAFNLLGGRPYETVDLPEIGAPVELKRDISLPVTGIPIDLEFQGQMVLGGLPLPSEIDKRRIKIKRTPFRNYKAANAKISRRSK